MTDTTTKSTIKILKQHFARYGIPNILMTDNGPQFTSHEFGSFTRNWEIQHHTSSPGYAKSNGKAENSVKTAKQLMRKAIKQKQTPTWRF